MRSDTLRTPLLITAAGLALMAVPVRAQDAPELQDGRWLPYLGCWVGTESVEGPMTCVVPDGEGVAMVTVQGNEVTDRRTIRADGQERPADVAGCTGTEAAEFSTSGSRVYTRTALTCGGADRSTVGLMAMVESNQWVEIQAVADDGGVAWVKRYREAPTTRVEAAGLTDAFQASPQAVQMARAASRGRITVDDLIEANARTHPEAVRAWIVEQGEPLRLNADRLIRLADAGVPPEVIDVAVAVSFPDHFAVGSATMEGQRSYGYDRFGPTGLCSTWSAFGPYYYDPYCYGYGRFSSWYGWGYGPGYIGYRPTVVVVAPSNPQARPGGRLIKGQGYSGSGSSSGAARPRSSIGPASSSGAQVGAGSSASRPVSKGKAKRRGSGGGS